MPPANMNEIIAALADGATGQRVIYMVWNNLASVTGGRQQSLWRPGTARNLGQPPAPPNAGETCDSATQGALRVVAPSGSNKLYVARMSMSGTNWSSLHLWDRLVHGAQTRGNSLSQITVNTPVLPARAAGRTDVRAFLELYGNWGATPTTATASYTNQSGVSGRVVTFPIPANVQREQMFEIPLLSGDTGVQSVETFQLGASTGGGTTNDSGITLAVPVGSLVNNARAGTGDTSRTRNPFETGLPALLASPCLFFSIISPSSTVNNNGIFASLNLVESS
jgi:hypothetical protein